MLLAASAAVSGAILSCCLSCVPGLHVYNLIGGIVVLVNSGNSDAEIAVPFAMGMIVGFAVINTVPSIILAAPDESAFFTVLPGQKFLTQGRGYEAVMVTSLGGIAGVFIVLLLGLLAPRTLPTISEVINPHTHWILWCVICFILMSEWPREVARGYCGWRRFVKAWQSLSAGLLTFIMAGLLGFVLFYRSPVPVEASFQNLMPAFVGLFTIPWLAMNIITETVVSDQRITFPYVRADSFLGGCAAGGLGGAFAAFFPVVTGGVGGLLAGHATGVRNDEVFLVSQGASKVVYYVGGTLLLFVPGSNIVRGGAAAILNTMHRPYSYDEFYTIMGCIALAGMVSVLMISPVTRFILGLLRKTNLRFLSMASFSLIIILVGYFTGFAGLGIMLVASGIGLVPVLFGSRRMNCLGVILLPLACIMSGVGDKIAGILGLI